MNQYLFVHLPRLKKDIKTPITYVQLGVLGDLCLSRVNQEIYDYHKAQTDTPIRTVFLCDTFMKVDTPSGKCDFLAYLYKKCTDYNSVNFYFTSVFLQAIKDSQLKSFGQTLTECEIRGLISIYKETALTKLGNFLMDNYQCTKADGSQAVGALMSKAPDETNWIFFLAIAPDYYGDFIDAVFNYFTTHKVKDETKKIFLLEKPFQTNSVKSSLLSKKLNALHKKHPNFKFFAIDHYAAKWSIAHIPYLMEEVPSFRDFVNESDEIIIELLERQKIPRYRLNYMANTGLYLDMMPHALVPLQFIYAGKIVSWTAESIVQGTYEGYTDMVGEWLTERGERGKRKLAELNIETYFSLKLTLTIKDDEFSEGKIVKVYIRSGKGMMEDRKRVIIKNNTRDRSRASSVTIDIANNKFYQTHHSGVSFPRQFLSSNAPERKISGYAKVLYDAMEYLTKEDDDAKYLIEILTTDCAAHVINNIEEIRNQLGECPKVEYPPNEKLVMDDNIEAVFLYPFEYLEERLQEEERGLVMYEDPRVLAGGPDILSESDRISWSGENLESVRTAIGILR